MRSSASRLTPPGEHLIKSTARWYSDGLQTVVLDAKRGMSFKEQIGVPMPSRTYWLDLFTAKTWDEFLAAGGEVSGFRETRWTTVQRIKPGDYLLCYITGISRFTAVYEVMSDPYQADTKIWEENVFTCRLKVREVVRVDLESAVPIHELHDELSIFQNLKSPHAWTAHVRGSPRRWNVADGKAIVNALMEARERPTVRPIDPRKLGHVPKALQTDRGVVTVPAPEDEEEEEGQATTSDYAHPMPDEVSQHTEVQFRLLKLGSDMGFDVWVAVNDRKRAYDGKTFAEAFKLKAQLPPMARLPQLHGPDGWQKRRHPITLRGQGEC